MTTAPPPVDPRVAVSDLLFEYADRIDAGDLVGMAELFRDATYRTAGSDVVLRGRDEVLAAQRAVVRLYDGSPRTHHHVTNVRVDVDGDTARARSYFQVVFAPPGDGPRIILTGRYDDRLALVDGGWRFTDRLIHLDQVGDLAGHLHLDRLALDDLA